MSTQHVNYYYCSGGTEQAVDVTFEVLAETPYIDAFEGDCRHIKHQTVVNIWVAHPYPFDISIHYDFHLYETVTPVFANPIHNERRGADTVLVIYAGNRGGSNIEFTYDYRSCPSNWQGTPQPVIDTKTETDLQASDSPHVNCLPPPPTCHLTVTDVTTTDETLLGANDGALTVSISGSTGGTVNYTITNGSVVHTNTTGIFTGLIVGQWQVHVAEAGCYNDYAGLVNILQGYFITNPFNVTLPSDVVASENPVIINLSTLPTGLKPNKDNIHLQLHQEQQYQIIFT